jgi:hypothetical protein
MTSGHVARRLAAVINTTEAFLYHSHHAANCNFEAITEMLTTIEIINHPHHPGLRPLVSKTLLLRSNALKVPN